MSLTFWGNVKTLAVTVDLSHSRQLSVGLITRRLWKHFLRFCHVICRWESRPYFLTARLGVTWRHRSRDHLIAHMLFPIGGILEPSLYL